jgi:ribonuclease Z
MNARSILLTHFSQRYQKIAQINETPKEKGSIQFSPSRQGAEPQLAEATTGGAAPDIPLDDEAEAEQPSSRKSAYELLDDIAFPERGRPGLSPKGSRIPGQNAPVAAAMDFMRVKVGDLIYAQAYAPALEKMIDVIERGSAAEAELQKKKRQFEDETKKAKKNKKHSKERAAEAAAVAAALAASIAADEDENKKSVWSASESEDGWETSDVEEEM